MNQSADSASLTATAVRDLARLRDVAFIVARHGFAPLVMRTPLGKRLLDKPVQDDPALRGTSAPARFTKLLAALGPTYIKFGQILSMRKDIFAAEWIDALETLQDDAPGLPLPVVREQVETGLGGRIEELFATFAQEPLATASIAQTHRARTWDGEEVVVKVQRPGIEAVVRSDLNLLHLAAQVLEANIDEMQLFGVVSIVEEFEQGLLQELDFHQEMSNLLEFQRNLDPSRKVTVPRPSGRLARGHRRRSLACSESDGERRLGGPVTRPGRGGACRHCSRRQARVVCPTASRDEPGVQGQAQRQPGAQAAAVAGFSLAAATAVRTSGPLCEPNRAGEAL